MRRYLAEQLPDVAFTNRIHSKTVAIDLARFGANIVGPNRLACRYGRQRVGNRQFLQKALRSSFKSFSNSLAKSFLQFLRVASFALPDNDGLPPQSPQLANRYACLAVRSPRNLAFQKSRFVDGVDAFLAARMSMPETPWTKMTRLATGKHQILADREASLSCNRKRKPSE